MATLTINTPTTGYDSAGLSQTFDKGASVESAGDAFSSNGTDMVSIMWLGTQYSIPADNATPRLFPPTTITGDPPTPAASSGSDSLLFVALAVGAYLLLK